MCIRDRPEEEGNTLLADVVIDEVTRGTVNFAPKVTLSDAVLAKPTVTRAAPALAEARDAANKHLGGALSLTMAGAEKMAIDVYKRQGLYYAQAINDNFGLDFDVVFGPAYKGIPLAVVTAMRCV